MEGPRGGGRPPTTNHEAASSRGTTDSTQEPATPSTTTRAGCLHVNIRRGQLPQEHLTDDLEGRRGGASPDDQQSSLQGGRHPRTEDEHTAALNRQARWPTEHRPFLRQGGTSRVAASRAPRTLEASTKEPVTPTTTLTTPASPSSNTARHPTTTLARSIRAHSDQ